jgi:serine protease
MISRIAFTSLAVALALSGLTADTPAPTLRAQSAPPASRKAAAVARLATDAALRAAAAEARRAPIPPSNTGLVPGLIAVKFAESLDPATMAGMAADHGASRITRPAFADFHLVTVGPDDDTAAVARALAAEPGVVYAEPVGRMRAHYRPNDPFYQYQWNLQQLEFERTWDINTGAASSVVVAVIDGGVAYTAEGSTYAQAPDLAGTTFVAGYDFIWDDDRPLDLDGHGTHVTGTIAQSTNNNLGVAGIAFNASIMPVKAISTLVDDLLGSPNVGDAAVVSQAIRFAAERGAKVINMSIGSSSPSTALRDALQFAVDRGAVVVISAGNFAEDGSPPDYPAAYAKDIAGVIAVAATDFAKSRAPYSNVNDYVELAAPGGDVGKDLNGDGFADGVLQQTIDFDAFLATGQFTAFTYAFWEGTSMAAPHVAGMAALLMDQGITDPKAIEAALKRFATDLGPPGRDNEYGYGLINPRATLRGLGLAR